MPEPTRLPVKGDKSSLPQAWQPFESLRRDIDRLYDDFGVGFLRTPFRRFASDLMPSWGREMTFAMAPAVDISDSENAYEVTAEMPGIDEKNIEVRVANGVLTIKGEKQDEKEEKKKDYYLRERSFGSFERAFQLPDGVDTDKIEANFKKGILTVTLPKRLEAQKAAKTINVKAA